MSMYSPLIRPVLSLVVNICLLWSLLLEPIVASAEVGGSETGWILSESGSISGSSSGTIIQGNEISPIVSEVVSWGLIASPEQTGTIVALWGWPTDIAEAPVSISKGDEILIQYKEAKVDLDTTFWRYEAEGFEKSHNLNSQDMIQESNITVVSVPESSPIQNSTVIPSSSFIDGIKKESVIETTMSELRKDPRVAYVQRNFIYNVESLPADIWRYDSLGFTGRDVPNDSDFTNLWWLDNQGLTINGFTGTTDADIDYPEAMAYASGRLLGSGTIVAVLDSWVNYWHPELTWHMWDGTNCLSDTGVTIVGWCIHGYDFVNLDNEPLDDYSVQHGTHVSGTIGGISNNGTGVTGVAPNVQIMAVKVLDSGGAGDTITIIRGINFAKYNGAKVINASLGINLMINSTDDFDYLTYDAIQAYPGLFIAAAGNASYDVSRNGRSYPAWYGKNLTTSGVIIDGSGSRILSGTVTIPGLDNVMSIAASDQNDLFASFSNYGTTVDLIAPGKNIYSTTYRQAIIWSSTIFDSANGWSYLWTGSTEWTTKTWALVVSGALLDLSGVLWWDTNTPYTNDAVAMIEKTFTNPQKDIIQIRSHVWCDTPTTGWDYIDVQKSDDGVIYTSIATLDENQIRTNSTADSYPYLWIDGHEWAYALMSFVVPTTSRPDSFKIRFVWQTNSGTEIEGGQENYGCFIQDSYIARYWPTYRFLNGTSMATPHVTGAAALAWNFKPGATVSEVKNAIITSWDYKVQFEGKLANPVRLNILNMLETLEVPTVSVSASTGSIAYSGTSIISWSSTSATGCSTPWGSTATGGTFTTPQLVTNTTYVVSCTGSGGTASGSVTVNVAPLVSGSGWSSGGTTPPIVWAGGGGGESTWGWTSSAYLNAILTSNSLPLSQFILPQKSLNTAIVTPNGGNNIPFLGMVGRKTTVVLLDSLLMKNEQSKLDTAV